MENQELYMQKALELALNGAGYVSPNPLVGALIIRDDGTTIAEGWHKEFGGLHAEIEAINAAKQAGIKDFSNTTLVVNLEPCCHTGKQPPCVDAIINAKIPNVIVGMKDPNALVAGQGIERLTQAGINMVTGVLEDDCHWINRYYCHYIMEGMPYIVLKVAQTLDGCIATKDGESQWISCEESRRRTHFLRSEMDAVMVGIKTILADNPLLDTRLLDKESEPRKRNPKIIILDSNLRTPPNSKVLVNNKERDVFVVYSDELENDPDINLNERKEKLEQAGAILWESPLKNGKLHLRKAISRLTFEYCFTSLLVEGGGELFSSFINSNLVNEMQIFTAPMVLGDGMRAYPNVLTEKLSDTQQFQVAGSLQSGTDIHTILIK